MDQMPQQFPEPRDPQVVEPHSAHLSPDELRTLPQLREIAQPQSSMEPLSLPPLPAGFAPQAPAGKAPYGQPSYQAAMDEDLNRSGRWKAAFSVLAILATFVAEVLAFIVLLFCNVPEESLWNVIVPEAFGAVAAILAVILLGGRSWASISREDVAYTFRFGWWCLVVSVGLMALDTWDFLASGTSLAPDFLARLAQVSLACLFVGIYEEFLFRGVVLNGLLAVMGKTHRGLIRALVLTSLIFGAAHVDFSTDFAEPLMAVQGLLKIVQTALYSFMLCVIVLRTRRLGGVSLFHGFDDFLVVIPTIVLYGEDFSTDYVVAGDEANSVILLYLVIIALYLPFVVKSWRELERGGDVYLGAFMEDEVVRARAAAQAQVQASRPAGLAPDVAWGAPDQPALYDLSASGYGVPVPATSGAYEVPDASTALTVYGSGAPSRRPGSPPAPTGFR